VLKKVRRGDLSLADARSELADGLADVAIYLDILAYRVGVDLGEAVVRKFNRVSVRVGCDIRLTPSGVKVRPASSQEEKPQPTAQQLRDAIAGCGVQIGQMYRHYQGGLHKVVLVFVVDGLQHRLLDGCCEMDAIGIACLSLDDGLVSAYPFRKFFENMNDSGSLLDPEIRRFELVVD
jgi:hypothetical protein